MVELKYIGTHQPKGMVIEVDEENVKKYLDSGEYERVISLVKATKLLVNPKEVIKNDIRNRIS